MVNVSVSVSPFFPHGKNDTQAKEAWDELEKSVVAKVADDVKVAISGDAVEMIIVKTMH